MERVNPKINAPVWLCYMKKNATIIMKIKGATRCRGQTLIGT